MGRRPFEQPGPPAVPASRPWLAGASTGGIQIGKVLPGGLYPLAAPFPDVIPQPGVSPRELQHHLLDEMGDGVQFDRGSPTTEPGCLQGDRPSACKHVEDSRRVTSICIEYFSTRLRDRRCRTAPAAQRVKERGSFDWVATTVLGWDHRRIHRSSRSSQRTTSPPKVELARVKLSVANLLPLRDDVDGVDREKVLD